MLVVNYMKHLVILGLFYVSFSAWTLRLVTGKVPSV